jgi:hypothetical protein
MPLLMTQKVDRQLLYLNEGAYAVYIESADTRGGDPWVRWARNFDRCLPLGPILGLPYLTRRGNETEGKRRRN